MKMIRSIYEFFFPICGGGIENQEIEEVNESDDEFPKYLHEVIGQKRAVKILNKITIDTFKQRAEKDCDFMPKHIVLHGPPGLGKSTLAKAFSNGIFARRFFYTGTTISRRSDIDSIIKVLSEKLYALLFIDEVHRMPERIEEELYEPMQDGQYHGEDLRSFTMVGTTTILGMLSKPLRDRFTYKVQLEPYEDEDLARILATLAEKQQNAKLSKTLALEMAKRAQGIPRVAKDILEYSRLEKGDGRVYLKRHILEACQSLGLDRMGLNEQQRALLRALAEHNTPIGRNTLCAMLDTKSETLEQVIERFLIKQGFILKTSGGRVIADKGREYIELVDSGNGGLPIGLINDEKGKWL